MIIILLVYLMCLKDSGGYSMDLTWHEPALLGM